MVKWILYEKQGIIEYGVFIFTMPVSTKRPSRIERTNENHGISIIFYSTVKYSTLQLVAALYLVVC